MRLWRLESEIPIASLDASTPGELPICSGGTNDRSAEFHHPVQRLLQMRAVAIVHTSVAKSSALSL